MRVEVNKKHQVFLKFRQQQDNLPRREKEKMMRKKQGGKIKKMRKA